MRKFDNLPENSIVALTYKRMYQEQTRDKITQYQQKVHQHGSWSLFQILDKLNCVYDESDPDTREAQSIHGYQTGERIRKMYFKADKFQDFYIEEVFRDDCSQMIDSMPKQFQGQTFRELYPEFDFDCLPLIGLIHDFGKVLMLPEFGGLPQHFVVGDTYPIGIKPDVNMPFYELAQQYLEVSPEQNFIQGFDNLTFSYSHDWYLAQILKHQSKLPGEALYIIKYHSFYPWVAPHAERGYQKFASDYDWKMLPLLKLFQRADLYSKEETPPDIENIKSYYTDLIDRYVGGKLLW